LENQWYNNTINTNKEMQMSKRRPRQNVNGKVPPGTPRFIDLPDEEKDSILKRIERFIGQDWETVCGRFEQEMDAVKRKEREAAEAKKGAKR
jgi:hypothetical protein